MKQMSIIVKFWHPAIPFQIYHHLPQCIFQTKSKIISNVLQHVRIYGHQGLSSLN
jgi:hypothetical protein